MTTTTTTRDEETEVPVAAATCTPESSDVEDNNNICEEEQHGNDDTERTEDDVDNESSTSDIPEEFICPLTLEIFTDPLMDRRGMNWERSAILEWLNRGNTTCPLTREPMGFRSLIPNTNLRTRVEHWKRENGYIVTSSPPMKKRWEDSEENVVAYIEAPPGSTLEMQYTHSYMQARAAAIVRRMERREHEQAARQQQQQQSSQPEESNSNDSRRSTPRGGSRRRRRLSLTRSSSTPTGYSPATQQRRLAGLLGEALAIVRRPPLASAED